MKNTTWKKLRDWWYYLALAFVIQDLRRLIDYSEMAGKHRGFVQANLCDALANCFDAGHDWHTNPNEAHEFDLEERGL